MSKINNKTFILSSIVLGLIVIIANYSIQFQIGNTPLTFGALTYPFSFLLLDSMSEKYSKKEVSKVVFFGILIALIPSYFAADPQIAIASIAGFCIAQPIDIALFYFFKKIAPKLWWLRSTGSTLITQCVDTLIFFFIAFYGVKTADSILSMAAADYMIKMFLGLSQTPLFYIIAIRTKKVFTRI